MKISNSGKLNVFLLISLGLIMGVICGLLGTVFSKTLSFVTNLRIQNNWLLFLLPIGGLISVGIYKLCRVKSIGTTNVFEAVRTEQNLPPLLAFVVFCGTCLSHLFGASVGREGAAIQIGGGIANVLSRLLGSDEDTRHQLIMCGMAALFSAVFGTPLAACVFVLEVILTRLCLLAAVPVLCSSFMSYFVALYLGVHPERFNVGSLPSFSISFLWKIAVITLICVLVAFIFCKGLALGKSFTKKIFKNEFLRIAIGGIIIVILTLLMGTRDYNGGGIDVIERVFDGTVKYEAFIIKLAFTVICISFGYKGGEIIPTLFIGATLGGALATLFALPIGTGAAIGMAVLFVCATKCPFATILLCCEMFGFSCAPLVIPVIIFSFIISRYKGLYGNNKDYINLLFNK